MNKELKGLRKIFAFTLRQQITTKGYRAAVAVGVLLCLCLPVIIMTAVEVFGGSDSGEEAFQPPDIAEVFVVDISSTPEADLSVLNQLGFEYFTDIKYTACGGDIDSARQLAAAEGNSLMLVIDEVESGYVLSVVLPENSALTKDDARVFENFIQQSFSYVLMEKSGLDYSSLMTLMAPVSSEVSSYYEADGEEISPEDESVESFKHLISYFLPFVLIMVMYFLVLFYGQGVSTSVIMEKNSKLMDYFLITVRPGAMVIGKVLAIALAAAIQFLSWAIAAVCGFALGTLAVTTINPDTQMLLIQIFRGLGALAGMFSAPGLVMALFLLLSGFLLYCSLAAIGGALAGKPEDLSSTNVIFTLVLIISFFAVIYGGLSIEGSSPTILSWIPFTAILITPAQLIMGEMSIIAGLGVLAIVLAVSLLIMLLAGKLYKTTALHKGDPPKLSKVIGMLRG